VTRHVSGREGRQIQAGIHTSEVLGRLASLGVCHFLYIEERRDRKGGVVVVMMWEKERLKAS